MNDEIIIGLVGLVAGFLMLIFRGPFAREIIEAQNRGWGFHFGEREIRISRFVVTIVGIVSIIIGILSLFQIIDY